MSKQAEFFIYLIERYAEAKNRNTAEVLEEWEMLRLRDFIYDMYEIYHVERLENAFDDIDKLISEKKQ